MGYNAGMRTDEPIRPDEGGEPPCLMEHVCLHCGTFVQGERCPECGAPPGAGGAVSPPPPGTAGSGTGPPR